MQDDILLLTQTAYAKHVNLCQQRISKLVAEGLPTINGKIDPVAADAWIATELDPERRARVGKGDWARAESVQTPRVPPAQHSGRKTTRVAAPKPEPPRSNSLRGNFPLSESTTEVRRQKLAADAGLAKLKLKEREGSLVPREAAENFVFEEGRKIRDGWIAWIARTAPALAHELQSDPQQTFAALDRLVRDHIREISE